MTSVVNLMTLGKPVKMIAKAEMVELKLVEIIVNYYQQKYVDTHMVNSF